LELLFWSLRLLRRLLRCLLQFGVHALSLSLVLFVRERLQRLGAALIGFIPESSHRVHKPFPLRSLFGRREVLLIDVHDGVLHLDDLDILQARLLGGEDVAWGVHLLQRHVRVPRRTVLFHHNEFIYNLVA